MIIVYTRTICLKINLNKKTGLENNAKGQTSQKQTVEPSPNFLKQSLMFDDASYDIS